MTSKQETLAFLRTFAACASRAADATGRNRQLSELRDVIIRQEKEHRAWGRRMVGNIGARMTVDQTCDYFVCKALVSGIENRRTADLDGLREDYVRGAILMHNKAFRTFLRRELKKAFPRTSEKTLFARVSAADYCTLIGGAS